MSGHRPSLLVTLLVVVASAPVFAQAPPGESSSSKLAIIPHIGVVTESAYVDGPIVFSDGDVDFLLVEPDTGLQLGVELSYAFSPTLAGVLGLSYTFADARYIENNDLRRDVGFDTLRIQPGVMVNVMTADKLAVDVGGGLTLFQTSIEGLVWNNRRVDPSGFGLGLFGGAAIDVPLTGRLSLHGHLLLELSRPSYGALEDDIAFADGEAGASVDHDLRLGLALGIGLRIAL